MKKLLSLVALSLCVLALNAPSALAQSSATAKVPFPFIVDGHVLPAGEYRVAPAADLSDVLQIISADGQSEALTLVESVESGSTSTSEPCTFQFRKVGDHYFLSQIDIQGEASLRVTLSDKEISAAIASITAASSPTTR
jgi:hypothetical protein